MKRLLYVQTKYPELSAAMPPFAEDVTARDLTHLPSVGDVREADVVLMLGRVGDWQAALQLAGILELTLAQGVTFVVAFDEWDEGLGALVERLTQVVPRGIGPTTACRRSARSLRRLFHALRADTDRVRAD